MQRIEELQAIVAAQQARIDYICAQLGFTDSDLPAEVSSGNIDSRPTGTDYSHPVKEEISTVRPEPVAEPEKDEKTAIADLYTDQPLIIDNGAAFDAGYVEEYPNCYKLIINGSRGKFELNESEEFYDRFAYTLADMVIPVADYAVDQVPNGSGGFNMADLADCKLCNVEPGEILLDGQFWKVTKKAKVQFKLK